MKAIIWDFNDTLYNANKEELFENAEDVLSKAKNSYYQALVTTSIGNKSEREALIKEMGIWDIFDHIKIGIKTAKVFEEAVHEVKCKNDQVFVIGDSYSKEIRIGNKLGMKTVWFTLVSVSQDSKKHYCKKISDLSELYSILNL